MHKPLLVGASLLLSISVSSASADLINPAGYDMPNGSGQAHGGTFNYWDRNYLGIGPTSDNVTDGAYLYGGFGKLTDGNLSTQRWDAVSNDQGTGPYVGWLNSVTPNPEIVFHFPDFPKINTVYIQMDNSEFGGVYAPRAVFIDGVNAPFTPPAAGSVGVVQFSGLNLIGNEHTITFNYQSPAQQWIFVSEIWFQGTAAPEPATWALMLMGFAGLGFMGHRARRARAA